MADRDRLCAGLHDVIHSHLLSITEVPVDAWNLRARIEPCRMEPHAGIVRQVERAGAALARRFGVKSLAGIRFVAFGLLLLALLAALLPGVSLLRSS